MSGYTSTKELGFLADRHLFLCMTQLPVLYTEVKPFAEEGLVNALGGCCGSRPDHIAAIVKMAKDLPPRKQHSVEPALR